MGNVRPGARHLTPGLVAVLILVTAGCSPPHHVSRARGTGHAITSSLPTTTVPLPLTTPTWPSFFEPNGVSFVSPEHGWAIGTLGCQTCLGVEVTEDGGSTWNELPTPDVSVGNTTPSSVSNIYFANTSDGYLFDPGLQVTTDGGHDWSLGSVSSVLQLVTDDGETFALSQLSSGTSPVQMFRAPVGTNKWTEVDLPAAARSSGQSVPSDEIHAAGDTLLLLSKGALGPQPTPPDLGGLWTSSDGGMMWTPRRVPCTAADGGAATASIALGHSGAWLVDCFNNEQSQQEQATQHHLYGTANAGRSWVRLSNPAYSGGPVQLVDNGAGKRVLECREWDPG